MQIGMDSGQERTASRPESERSAAARAAAGMNLPDGLFALLVESVQDYAIFALDPKGLVVSWNMGAHRLKGYQPEEIIGARRHYRRAGPRVFGRRRYPRTH